MRGFEFNGNDTILAVSALRLTGNVIPQAWYKRITRANGKPHLNAITILAEVCYWYRLIEITDPDTGETVLRQKFRGNTLQMQYCALAEKFGLTRAQVKAACDDLVERGLILVTHQDVKLNGETFRNRTFITPMAQQIAALSDNSRSILSHTDADTTTSASTNNDVTQFTQPHDATEMTTTSNRIDHVVRSNDPVLEITTEITTKEKEGISDRKTQIVTFDDLQSASLAIQEGNLRRGVDWNDWTSWSYAKKHEYLCHAVAEVCFGAPADPNPLTWEAWGRPDVRPFWPEIKRGANDWLKQVWEPPITALEVWETFQVKGEWGKKWMAWDKSTGDYVRPTVGAVFKYVRSLRHVKDRSAPIPPTRPALTLGQATQEVWRPPVVQVKHLTPDEHRIRRLAAQQEVQNASAS